MLTRKDPGATQMVTGLDPDRPLRRFAQDIDRMLSGMDWPFFQWRGFSGERRGGTWFPGLDVFERDGKLVAKMDLPGVRKEDVAVEIVDGYLRISGQRKSEAEEHGETFYRCEREFGTFVRTVPLPEGTKSDDITAVFAEGVLEVKVPLPAPVAEQPHKVTIEERVSAKTAA